jgi:hypothetical protein
MFYQLQHSFSSEKKVTCSAMERTVKELPTTYYTAATQQNNEKHVRATKDTVTMQTCQLSTVAC